jgi:enoyl-CoA hydratase/carnithine racemase
MDADRVELVPDGPVLHVWLNRPEARNALDDRALTELATVFAGVGDQFDVKVVVLGGRGPSFSAGADRRNPPGDAGPGKAGVGERERRWRARVGDRAFQAIADCEAITVARLHGHVVGGGLALALACDFRVAAESTLFRLPEVDLGLPLTWGTVPRLISEIGAARARELTLLCEQLDARRADQLGVVHRVVPESQLDSTVRELTTALAAKPEMSAHITKTQFRAYAQPFGDASFADADLRMLSMRSTAAEDAFGARQWSDERSTPGERG